MTDGIYIVESLPELVSCSIVATNVALVLDFWRWVTMNEADWFAAIFVAGVFLTLFAWLAIESWRSHQP